MFVCTVRYVCTCVKEGDSFMGSSFGLDLLFVQPFLVHVCPGSAVWIESSQ